MSEPIIAYPHEMICPTCKQAWTFVDYRGVSADEVRKRLGPSCPSCMTNAIAVPEPWALRIVQASKGAS